MTIEHHPAPAGSESTGVRVTANVTGTSSGLPSWAPTPPELPPVNPYEQQDPATLGEAAQIAAMDAPAARPGQYAIDVHPDHAGTPEAIAEVQGLQSLLYAAGMPANEGTGLMQAIAVELKASPEPMADAAFEQMAAQTHALLKGRLGEQEFVRRQEALGRLLTDLDAQSGGRLGDYLEENAHVLLKPLVYSRLLAHAARLDQRKRP